MTRLIDADGLLPMMKYATTDSEIGVFPVKIGFNEIAKVIDDAPTVDAQPVRHGKWLDIDSQMYTWKVRCDQCGHERSMMSTQGRYPKYCENCGAKMDGDKKKSYFPKGFFSKERPLAKGEDDETD